MRKYCTTIKNKAYIFLEVIIISFLFISLTLFVQILLNNSFKLYKIDYETQENFQNLDFLNEIMKVEIRYIEENINDGNIKNASEYIVLNKMGEKIFLTADPSKKISLGGYTLLNDEIKADSIPTLFCSEDDVIGEHAASVGKVDEAKLFYLMSRGLSENRAKKLIVESSFRPIMDNIDDEKLRDKLFDELERRI